MNYRFFWKPSDTICKLIFIVVIFSSASMVKDIHTKNKPCVSDTPAAMPTSSICREDTVPTNRILWKANTQLIHPRKVETLLGNNPLFPPVYHSIYMLHNRDALKWWRTHNSDVTYYLDQREDKNPNIKQLEIMLAKAQNREACLVFTSGMAAISSLFFSLLKQPSDTVICFSENHSLSKACLHTLRNFGIQFDEVSFHPYDDYLEQIQKKIQERLQEGKQVKLIHFEIPLGPMLRVVDIDAIVQLAKKYNILTSLDASLGGVHHYSAYDQIDIVCHALSKIANGHGDLLGGAIVGKKELIEQIYFKGQVLFGCEMDPYRAALLASHLKTYELRYDRQHASAKKVVDFLLNYNKKTKGETQTIRAIHYLGLDHHPDKAIISKQMQGRMGDIIILELDSQVAENGEEFCRRLKLFQMTWGSGYCESLVIPLNHFVNHGNSKKAIGRHQLIRLSIGLEDPDDLIADLKQALNLCNHPLHPSKWKLSTQFIHPFDPRDYPAYFKTYIPILPPIQHATLSVPAPNIDFFDKKQFLYTRGRHVTNTDLEQRLAEVQKREACLVYASKIAAITSTFFSLLEKDDRVIIFQEASRKTKCALEHFRDHFGIKLEVITLKEGYLQELTKKIEDKRNGNVKLIHFAPLFQPMLRLVDIDEICKIAYKNGVYTSMDGTLGGIHQYTGNSCKVDIMFHDLSKIPNGHGNVLGGSVAGKKELIEQIYAKGRHACGASLDPFGAYLIMNNLQSYMVRYKAHSKNTQKIAQYLTKHPHIKSVRCLGLSNHPDTQLRRKHDKHRKDSGELIIFEIKEDRHLNATMFCRKLKLFQMALGNGSVVSMAFPVHSYLEKDLLNKQATKCNDRWVRLSIGLEAVEDLINDLGEVLD